MVVHLTTYTPRNRKPRVHDRGQVDSTTRSLRDRVFYIKLVAEIRVFALTGSAGAVCKSSLIYRHFLMSKTFLAFLMFGLVTAL